MWRKAPAFERHRWLPPLASSHPFFIKTLLLYFCTAKAAATQQSWWACKIASIPPVPPPLSPHQPKGYWQCVVGVVWWPLLLLRRLIVFILSQFFSFLTPFFSPHFFHSFNSFIAHHLKMKACTTTTQWMNVRTMKRWLTGWSKAPLLNEWKKLREKCANLQHFN